MKVYAVMHWTGGYGRELHDLYATEADAERIRALLEQDTVAGTGYYVVAMEVQEEIEEELKAIQEEIDEFAE